MSCSDTEIDTDSDMKTEIDETEIDETEIDETEIDETESDNENVQIKCKFCVD
jgi:hypothetical protein